MQKKLIALAIASLATSAAFAQTADTVTLYGRADVGMVSRSGSKESNGVKIGADKRTTEMMSGVQAGSRIGVKGAENLGGGTKALFLAEFGIDVDSGSNPGTATQWWNRQSYVGFQSDKAGTILLGRQYAFRYISMMGKYDPFALGTVGTMAQLTTPIANRANNTVAYVSPSLAGLTVAIGHSFQAVGNENPQNTGDLRWDGILANYTAYGVDFSLNAEQAKAKDSPIKTKAYGLAAAYDFKVVKLSALYDRYTQKNGSTNLAKQNAFFVGAKAPIGEKLALKAAVGQNQNKLNGSNGKSTKFGLGLDYNVSKRTSFYLDYGKVTFKNGGGNITQVNTQIGNGTVGTGGFDFGVAHNF